MTNGIGKTNPNEKTTEDFDNEGMLQECPLFLFNDYVMHRWRVTSPRRKKSDVNNHNSLLFIGAVVRSPFKFLKEYGNITKESVSNEEMANASHSTK
jgi:hypothetical protein